MKPAFSIVIPAFNCRPTLELVIRCLEAQSFPRERFECLIVDDGSQDGTREFLGSYRPGIDLFPIAHPVNLGRSRARNTACHEAEGDILVFLDADMLPDPDWLSDYQKSFEQGELDVISGRRYHLNLGAKPSSQSLELARLAEAEPEELLSRHVAQQFQRLHATARLSMYPSPAMQKLEAQLPQVCQQYPDSLLCAYSFITSNVAVRRELFEKAGGFDPLMRRAEDTDLGVRLWEMGARLGFAQGAKAYHMYYMGQGSRDNTLAERQAFFYRHPYTLAILINLWFAYHNQTNPNPPSPVFDSLLTLLAAGQEHLDMDLEREYSRIYKQPLPAECICERDFMAQYYCEHSGISWEKINAYLDQAIARGLIARRRAGRIYFDFNHTTNWLRKCTTYQQYELRHTRYDWLQERMPIPRAEPLVLYCRGIYEIRIPRQALPEPLDGVLNIPLPIEHACQTDVQIMHCVPEDLLAYADPRRTLISQFPLRHAVDDAGQILLRYGFECRLREHVSLGNGRTGEQPDDLAKFLRPTYAPDQLPKAKTILKEIFLRPVSDSYTIARMIYRWVLDNARYFQSDLADHLILETGFGPCSHLARLFVNLCRLMRVPAREQCGAMLARIYAPDMPQRMITTGRFNILAHTWAEFYTSYHGWVPVEFSTSDLGERILTAVNVDDEQLRAQVTRGTKAYDDYYFGSMDPFRIYASAQAGQLPTYPIVSKMSLEALKMLILQTRYRLVCEFSDSPSKAAFSSRWEDMVKAEELPCFNVITPKAAEPIPEVTRAPVNKIPARIVLSSFGSTGDVQPFLALADELRGAGHEPVFAMPAHFEDRIRRFGFPFAAIGLGVEPDVWHGVFARQAEMTNPIEQTRHFLQVLMPVMAQMFQELQEICRDADALISPAFQLAARMVHDATGIPFVSVHFSPFGSKGGKDMREISAPIVNRYRREKGLPPLDDPLGADGASPQLALYAVSQHVFRPPAEWPSHYHLTGYFFFDEETWQPDRALAEFVEGGEPPVAVTFGSMPSDDSKALTDLVLEAVEQVGCRAILQQGGAGLARGRTLPENVYAASFVPHRWLFPRSTCVVHHGGAGTTAAAFRAGVATVVVPHLLDQPIWGEYARAFGCAGAVIPRQQLTAERLSAAITKTLSGTRYRRSAAKMGECVRAENGVQTARRLIEQLLSRTGEMK